MGRPYEKSSDAASWYRIPLILEDGIGLVPVAMGVFAGGEVLINLEESIGKREIFKTKISNLLPSLLEDTLRQSLIMSGGSFTIFLVRPFFLAFIGLAAILMAFPIIKWILGKKTHLAAGLPKEDCS